MMSHASQAVQSALTLRSSTRGTVKSRAQPRFTGRVRVSTTCQSFKLAILPGDGIGPEITAEAVRVLDAVANKFSHTFEYSYHDIGGIAIDNSDGTTALPDSTLEACKASDAVLLGAVGGYKWDMAAVRPEQGLLAIRKGMGLYANLRPVKIWDQLKDASPLKPEVVEGVDMLFVRELTGGIYFGEREEQETSSDKATAWDKEQYTVEEVERIVRVAGNIARLRGSKVTSVDKANVLAASRLWRRTADRVLSEEYPDVKADTVLVDAAAMFLIKSPAQFDVVVTSNMFGDILSDEASMIPGSLGMLASASVGEPNTPGLYEPCHGSAPDIAGQGIANPLATILSAAMLLRISLGLEAEADAVEAAVGKALDDGFRTGDIKDGKPGEKVLDCTSMGDAVIERL